MAATDNCIDLISQEEEEEEERKDFLKESLNEESSNQSSPVVKENVNFQDLVCVPEIRILPIGYRKRTLSTQQTTEQPLIPWFILGLSIVQLLIYILANDHWQNRLMFRPHLHHEYWRCFTYMFLHSDLLHLIINLGLQLLTGYRLELEQGGIMVASVYLGGVLAASLSLLILDSQVSMVGSSAGIYALLTSHIPHLIMNFRYMSFRYIRVIIVALLLISDCVFTTLHIILRQNRNPRICFEAHVSGAIIGLFGGFLIYRQYHPLHPMNPSHLSHHQYLDQNHKDSDCPSNDSVVGFPTS